jgi:DNA modification methylase
MKPFYEDKWVTIYHGDCREILPTLDTKVDLVLTDPPYGIGWEGSNASTRDWSKITGDARAMDLRFILNMDCTVISFGANFYPDQLPHRGRWICWDKRVDPKADNMLGSAFELAWVNKYSGFDKIYRVMHGGVVNSDMGRRQHPTQKPTSLFKMILLDYPNCKSVVDPFLGSGTTALACKSLSRNCVGIEIEERYAEIAAKRCSQEVMELSL